MSHEIETMMFVGEIPWHRLGVRVTEAPTTEDAIKIARLDWTVETRGLYYAAGAPGFEPGYSESRARAVVRTSDDRELGIVGSGWQPLQNVDAFKFFDPFVAGGHATIETAGSLRQGERVWILAKLASPMAEIAPGDPIVKYLLLANGHDGSYGVRVGLTPTRVVCANTLAIAAGTGKHDKGDGEIVRLSHGRHTAGSLAKIQAALLSAEKRYEKVIESYRALVKPIPSEQALTEYVDQVFAVGQSKAAILEAMIANTDARAKAFEAARVAVESRTITLDDILDAGVTSSVLGDIADETERQRSKVRERVIDLVSSGKGNDLASVRGTWWAAYNAITQYVTHERGRGTDAARLDSNIMGSGAALSRKALTLALGRAS